MTRSSDITSFTDFRTNLRNHLDHSKSTGRPLFVTSNGETEAVVLSAAKFDELTDLAELARSLALLDRSDEDIKAKRTMPIKDAVSMIANELGLKLDL